MALLPFVLIVCLIGIFIQDLKYRQIHIIFPVLIFSLSAIITFNRYGFNHYKIILYNTIFFITTLLIMVVYMSIKNKKLLNPFKNYFGLGDLLYYISITPLFLLHGYVIFFIASLVFSILLALAFKKISGTKNVPLAGYASLLLILVLANDYLQFFPPITLVKTL